MLTGSSQCRSAPLNPKHCQRKSFRESRQVPQQVNFYRWSEDAQNLPFKSFSKYDRLQFVYAFYEEQIKYSATRTSSLSEEPVVFPNRNWLHVFFGLDMSYCISIMGLGKSSKTYHTLSLHIHLLCQCILYFLVHF